jgi:hypothetical protein
MPSYGFFPEYSATINPVTMSLLKNPDFWNIPNIRVRPSSKVWKCLTYFSVVLTEMWHNGGKHSPGMRLFARDQTLFN